MMKRNTLKISSVPTSVILNFDELKHTPPRLHLLILCTLFDPKPDKNVSHLIPSALEILSVDKEATT